MQNNWLFKVAIAACVLIPYGATCFVIGYCYANRKLAVVSTEMPVSKDTTEREKTAFSAAPKKVERKASVNQAIIVAAHNRWRGEVGAPDLEWSDKLAVVAQEWADHLAGRGCAMYHSGNGYGENIYRASALMWPDGRREFRSVSSNRPVDAWGREKRWYEAETGKCSAEGRGSCGHYTQIVWKDTTEVGCAMSVCGNNGQIWVCNYSPAGNVAGEKPY